MTQSEIDTIVAVAKALLKSETLKEQGCPDVTYQLARAVVDLSHKLALAAQPAPQPLRWG